MKLKNIAVDSGTIAIMRLQINSEIVDLKKLIEITEGGAGYMKFFEGGKYERTIKDTWKGSIKGEMKLYTGWHYIGDPCYIFKGEQDERINFCIEFLLYHDNKTKKKILNNREIYDVNIIDNMGGDGEYDLFINKIK